MSNKEKYIQFCTEHLNIPVFSQPWWLDAVCLDQWDVILIEHNNKIVASFPYYRTKIIRNVFTQIGMPPLTQKLGPYIVYDSNETTENKKISYEHKIYNEIIDKIPKCDSFLIQFDWKYKNWLPFYWKGFKQTTRYTYIIDNIKEHDQLIKNYDRRKREKIQKTKNKLEFKFDLSSDEFYSYFADVIHERGDTVLFSKELFSNLYNAIYENKAGQTFYCIDAEKNIHAIHMVIWDNECAYSLMSMRSKKYNTSGGREFLVDAIIKYVSSFVDRFDFEGSMIKGVEESYRRHGAHQTEYYAISKCNNPVLRVYRAIKNN
jgi:hypothetical protein